MSPVKFRSIGRCVEYSRWSGGYASSGALRRVGEPSAVKFFLFLCWLLFCFWFVGWFLFACVVFFFVFVRVGGTHAKRVHIVELLEWVDASTCSKYSCGRCRMYMRGAVSEVGRDACARAVHGRSGVQFFEFLSRIMRGLLAVPYGIQ